MPDTLTHDTSRRTRRKDYAAWQDSRSGHDTRGAPGYRESGDHPERELDPAEEVEARHRRPFGPLEQQYMLSANYLRILRVLQSTSTYASMLNGGMPSAKSASASGAHRPLRCTANRIREFAITGRRMAMSSKRSSAPSRPSHQAYRAYTRRRSSTSTSSRSRSTWKCLSCRPDSAVRQP